MNILRKSIIVGVTLLGIGSAAMAAPAVETPRNHAYAETKFDPAKRAERIAQRQQKLHDALALTPNQEASWKTYIAAITPQQPVGRVDRAAFRDLPAPQRAEKRLESAKARVAQQESRLAALKTFYAVLTPEQQKVFDQHGATGKRGGDGRHHSHRRG
ncbi:Spy/CpxP family protein refolding chaperone [Massilia sp. METH4]|uniref:Spy/CpxP family protein refolding chaperone n=1 Tax=Massilia sp. METH4 TaxID=3123041 RepID=UPI0030CF4D79